MAKKSKRFFSTKYGKLLPLLIIILGMAAYGTYYFVFSKAVEGGPGQLTVTSTRVANSNTAKYTFYSSPLQCHGDDDNHDGIYDGTGEYGYPCQTTDLMIVIFNDPKTFTYSGNYTCLGYGACVPVVDRGDRLVFCTRLSQAEVHMENMPILTIELTDTSSDRPALRYAESYWDYLTIYGPTHEGSCANDMQTYQAFDETTNYFRHGTFGRAAYGTGTGSTGTGTGNGGTGIGSGTGKTGGTGAKGGGSANQQSNQPNPVPSDSAQGTTQAKPGQTPSPFYDGKQYAAGSDSESRQNVASSIAGQAADSWPYIVPAVVLLGAGGVLYWRLRKRK